jgi:hypothetical protein
MELKKQTCYLDGMNICYWEDRQFSVAKLLILCNALTKLGYNFICYLDASFLHQSKDPLFKHYSKKLLSDKARFKLVPSGSRADDYILFDAIDNNNNGYIISHDRYGTEILESQWLTEEMVSKHLIMGQIFVELDGTKALKIPKLRINEPINSNLEQVWNELDQNLAALRNPNLDISKTPNVDILPLAKVSISKNPKVDTLINLSTIKETVLKIKQECVDPNKYVFAKMYYLNFRFSENPADLNSKCQLYITQLEDISKNLDGIASENSKEIKRTATALIELLKLDMKVGNMKFKSYETKYRLWLDSDLQEKEYYIRLLSSPTLFNILECTDLLPIRYDEYQPNLKFTFKNATDRFAICFSNWLRYAIKLFYLLEPDYADNPCYDSYMVSNSPTDISHLFPEFHIRAAEILSTPNLKNNMLSNGGLEIKFLIRSNTDEDYIVISSYYNSIEKKFYFKKKTSVTTSHYFKANERFFINGSNDFCNLLTTEFNRGFKRYFINKAEKVFLNLEEWNY